MLKQYLQYVLFQALDVRAMEMHSELGRELEGAP